MIDYYSGVDTEYFAGVGDIMVLCHRRLAVVNLFFPSRANSHTK